MFFNLYVMKNVQSIILLLVVQFTFAQNKQPKLVVGTVVDQMKMELTSDDFDLDEEGYTELLDMFKIKWEGDAKEAFELFFNDILNAAKDSGKLELLAGYASI